MYMLSCVDKYAHSAHQQDVYVLDIHRADRGLAAISSNQSLKIFDPARLAPRPVWESQTSHGNLTCLRMFDAGNSILCTAGEDGTVSVWDVRQDASGARVAHFQAAQAPITSLACEMRSHTIAVGTELQGSIASILLWDVRANPSQRLQYNEVHSDDVTELEFHPHDANVLLSGSTDGLVNVYDTRIADEDEVVIQTFNHSSSVHHAAFLSNTEVYAISHDERFALYNMAEEFEKGSAMVDFGDVREVLGCQYVARVSPKADGSGAILGAGSQDRQMFELVHLSKGNGWGFDKESSVGLPGAHGGELVRAFCFYDENQVVFTAGEDGEIKAWRPSA